MHKNVYTSVVPVEIGPGQTGYTRVNKRLMVTLDMTPKEILARQEKADENNEKIITVDDSDFSDLKEITSKLTEEGIKDIEESIDLDELKKC